MNRFFNIPKELGMDISLDQAIKGFRLYNEAAGRSKNTYRWYEMNLRHFHRWIEKRSDHMPHLEEITAEDLRNYLSELRNLVEMAEKHPEQLPKNRVRSHRTIRGYYASLSAFFNWAVREEIIEKTPMKNIPRPKVPRYIPDPFNEQEIRALLTACKKLTDRSSLRMTAMVLFLLDTGVRIGEILGLKQVDLDLEHGQAKVMGKGAKERYVYFGRTTKRALWRYISLARPEPDINVDTLFICFDGRPIQKRHFEHLMTRLGKSAGVVNVHPHRFRRTAAVQFLRNGGNIFALQKLLGHETLEMVRRYVELASDDVAEAHRKASPVDVWRL
jgi:site-specific recombinase XerD